MKGKTYNVKTKTLDLGLRSDVYDIDKEDRTCAGGRKGMKNLTIGKPAMQKKLLSVTLAALVILLAGVAQARVSSLQVAVDGMACPFCAFGIEKKLKKVAGVSSLVIDMQEGTVSLTAEPGQSINFSQIPDAVRDAGFTPGTIKIVANGTITLDAGRQFQLNIDGRNLQLVETKNLGTQLRSAAQNGKPVTMRGILHERKKGAWTLSPESIVLEEAP